MFHCKLFQIVIDIFIIFVWKGCFFLLSNGYSYFLKPKVLQKLELLHNQKYRHAVLFHPQICYDVSRFEYHCPNGTPVHWLETSFESSLSISQE